MNVIHYINRFPSVCFVYVWQYYLSLLLYICIFYKEMLAIQITSHSMYTVLRCNAVYSMPLRGAVSKARTARCSQMTPMLRLISSRRDGRDYRAYRAFREGVKSSDRLTSGLRGEQVKRRDAR